MLVQLNAQVDTSKIYNTKNYKRGIYKNAKEFLTNSPSIQIPFDYTSINLKDSSDTITAATLSLLDSTNTLGIVYGFCDGQNIFVQYPFKRKNCVFYKLQIVDFFSCFTCTHNDNFALGALGNLLNDAINGNPEYDLMQINSQGFITLMDNDRMKMLLSRNQALLKEYKKKLDEIKELKKHEEVRYNINFLKRRLMIEYLAKLNKVI